MRYLYYCNSAYQLINILNLHNQRMNCGFENIANYSADLILLNAFKGAEEIAQNIDKEKVFDKVFCVNRLNNSGLFHSVLSFIDIAFPSEFIYRGNKLKKDQFYNCYDYLVVPKFSRITAAIWQLNKKAKLQICEDGLGTYYLGLDSFLVSKSNSYKKMYKLFNHKRDFLDFEKIYLNYPNLYRGKYDNKILSIPKANSSYLEKIKDYFPQDFNDNLDKDIYWLSQHSMDTDINKIISSSLLEHSEKVICCPHPRYKDDGELPFIKSQGKIWEIRCLGLKNIDNYLLLSVNSTACLTPKMLFNKEPYVILTYKLMDNQNVNSSLEYVINEFKKTYKNPEKIMIPETKKELDNYINSFVNKNDKKDS